MIKERPVNKNPYEILGVSESATDDEIKDAYRALAKKYHPDKYIDEGLKEMATSKMQEINEAYDTIKEMRAKGQKYSTYSGGTYSGTGGYAEIRNLINMGRYSAAEALLNNIPVSDRAAEWHFLKGCILLRRGWIHDATKFFDTACRMDPTNQEYRAARLQVEKMSHNYDTQASRECNVGKSGLDCCCDLLCLDAMCECIGCDLIRCC